MKEKDKAKSNKKLTLKKTVIRDLAAKEGAKVKGGVTGNMCATLPTQQCLARNRP